MSANAQTEPSATAVGSGTERGDADGTALELKLVALPHASVVFRKCAELHAKTIPGGFLSSLGPGVLGEFYRSIAALPEAFLIVAWRGDMLVGLIAGSTDTKALSKKFLINRSWRLAPALPGIVLRGSLYRKVWETLRYPSTVSAPDLPDAEILNFCIDPELQRSGIGQHLFGGLERQFALRGIPRIRIVTGSTQKSAQAFYEARGAVTVGQAQVHGETTSLIYTYTIPAHVLEDH